ncbi:MAG: hypothetical protein M1823_000189 [Watsoniomyces obsoletus]|nr:MAG: hypothetical protein M1823_000189 [Watsoniomyces obsoletus]
MASQKPPSEADIIQNKLNMLFASQQRLLQNWLPPLTPEETAANQKSAEELQKEEEAMFRPMPANLGVGAPLPKDMSEGGGVAVSGRHLSSDDRLRKKLLGKRAGKVSSRTKDGLTVPTVSEEKNKHKKNKVVLNEQVDAKDDDDEEDIKGRSATVGRLKPRNVDGSKRRGDEGKDMPDAEDAESSSLKTSKKRPASFLDVMLAEKSEKKRRKLERKLKKAADAKSGGGGGT